MNTLVFFL